MDNMRIMPILLLDEIVPYPKCTYTISIDDDEYVEAVKASMGADSYLMLVNAKDYSKGVTENNIYRIGIIAKIKNAMRGLDGGIKLSVNCVERAYIDSVQRNSDYTLCQVEPMVEINTADEVKKSASVEVLKDLFAKYRGAVPMLQPALVNDVKKTNDLGTLCDKLCDKLITGFEYKRNIIEETDVY